MVQERCFRENHPPCHSGIMSKKKKKRGPKAERVKIKGNVKNALKKILNTPPKKDEESSE